MHMYLYTCMNIINIRWWDVHVWGVCGCDGQHGRNQWGYWGGGGRGTQTGFQGTKQNEKMRGNFSIH